MLRASLKGMAKRKGRVVLTSIAIVLGTMFVSASMVLTASLNKSLTTMFSDIYSEADYVVQHAEANPTGASADGAPVTPSQYIPASTLEEIRQLDGVETATGDISAMVTARDADGKTLGGMQPTMGFNWESIADFMELDKGNAPSADDEIIVSNKFLKDAGLELGDTSDISTMSTEREPYTVVGTYDMPGNRDSFLGETQVAFTTSAAQSLMAQDRDAYMSITVIGDADKEALENAAGSDFEVLTSAEADEQNAEGLQMFGDIIGYIFFGFGVIAIIVSVFLIINTFTIVVAQRQKELALMRAMGATRGQATRSILLEALIVGIIGSLIGYALGIGLGVGLSAIVGNTLFEGLPVSMVIPASSTSAIVIGVIVTLLAAFGPARRAGKVPPVAAMRDAANPPKPLRGITIVGSIVTLIGVGLMFGGLNGMFEGNTLAATFAGVAITFIGSILLTPILATPLVSVLGRLFGVGITAKLGRLNASRSPRRTAITASALMISIALVTAIASIVSSLKATSEDYFSETLQSDLIVSQASMAAMPTGIPADINEGLSDIDGVESVADMYTSHDTKVDGKDSDWAFNSTGDIEDTFGILGITVDEGSLSDFDRDSVLIGEDIADEENLEVGDTVTLTLFDGTEADLTVTAVTSSENWGGSWWMSPELSEHFQLTKPFQTFIEVSDDASVSAVQDEIDTLLADEQELTVTNNAEFIDEQTGMLDNVIIAVQVLMGLAVLIAIIGVINTLVLSVLERTRELGMLRAIGMTRPQIRRMVTAESIIICLFGAILGLAVGIGLGYVIQQGLKDEGITVFALPWGLMITYLIAALVVGFIAALAPAARAAKLNMLQAITTE
ncbi:ABC transporter permease [Haloglycomyces albus]|uniref:ABC transporter permease n=1 Tax=Haloglycomyces albus TaxID=526067 RepID=UPI00046CE831|nr:FtsX-like permease family protein [Haloglycomyces albus]